MADEGVGASPVEGPGAEAFQPDFTQIAQTYALQALMGCGLIYCGKRIKQRRHR